MSDAVKIAENGSDVAKVLESSSDATKAIDSGSDAEKNVTDFEKASDNIDDDNSHETTISDNEYEPGIVVDKYKNFSKYEELKAIPGEAHHTFQDAAFNYVVDTGEAYCVKLDGDLV